jgi:hypothetical protein
VLLLWWWLFVLVFVLFGLLVGVAGFQGCRVAGFQGLRVSGFQGFRVSGFQGFRVSRFQGFRVSGFQGFRVSGFQGFRVSPTEHERRRREEGSETFIVRWRCSLALQKARKQARGASYEMHGKADKKKEKKVKARRANKSEKLRVNLSGS